MSAPRGMSLVELLIAIAIFSVLIALGLPSYQQWMRNTRIRNAAESIQNALSLARGEAVRRSANVRFELDANDNASWSVCALGTGSATTCQGSGVTLISSYAASSQSRDVQPHVSTDPQQVPPGDFSTPLTALTANPTAGSSGVTFTPLGRTAAYGTGDLTRIDLAASTPNSDDRWLVVAIAAGGMVRLCDPQLSTTTSPQGCAP